MSHDRLEHLRKLNRTRFKRHTGIPRNIRRDGTRPGPARTLQEGVPTVTDGDTLVIRGVKVRLHGIDAPESTQQCLRTGKTYGCGREAASALADLVRNKTVTCIRKDTDRYGRLVGVCTVGGTEVNR